MFNTNMFLLPCQVVIAAAWAAQEAPPVVGVLGAARVLAAPMLYLLTQRGSRYTDWDCGWHKRGFVGGIRFRIE